MGARAGGTAPEDHARQTRRRAPSDRCERAGQQSVQLEAVAAAARRDKLIEKPRGVERNFPSQQDVEVLERDVRELRALNHLETCGIRRNGPGDADAS